MNIKKKDINLNSVQQDYALKLDNLRKSSIKTRKSHTIPCYLNYFIYTYKTCILYYNSPWQLFSFFFFFFYRYLVRASSAISYTHTCIRISIHIWIYICACICMRMHGYLRGGRIYVYEFMWWFVCTREIGTYAPLCECIWIRRKGITCYTVMYAYVTFYTFVYAHHTHISKSF